MLKGSLDDFTLPDIFRLLSSCSRTGNLEIHRSAGRGQVFFKDGEIYFAESSLTRDPLGQKLVRARLISETQLRQALDQHAETGTRLGEVLVASGALSQEQIEGAVRQQIEDAVFDLLRWELGEFAWNPGNETEVEVAITVSVENLIMEASRKLEELEVIGKKIPSETAVLAMTPTPPEDAAEINITPEEWRILVLVNGNRSVADIADSVGLDNFSTMRTLYGLASAGLIEVIDAPPVPALEEFAEALQVETNESQEASSWEPEVVEGEAPPVADVEPSSAPLDVEPEGALEEKPEVVEPELGIVADVAEDPVEEPVDEPVDEPSVAEEPLVDEIALPLEDQLDSNANPFDIEPEAQEDPNNGEIPVTSDPDEAPEAVVDRLAAVKELADLFDQGNPDAAGPPYPAELEAERLAKAALENGNGNGNGVTDVIGDGRRRVEDDEEITRGLISRLIDGVKGL